jgi:hypothetical protein
VFGPALRAWAKEHVGVAWFDNGNLVLERLDTRDRHRRAQPVATVANGRSDACRLSWGNHPTWRVPSAFDP